MKTKLVNKTGRTELHITWDDGDVQVEVAQRNFEGDFEDLEAWQDAIERAYQEGGVVGRDYIVELCERAFSGIDSGMLYIKPENAGYAMFLATVLRSIRKESA